MTDTYQEDAYPDYEKNKVKHSHIVVIIIMLVYLYQMVKSFQKYSA